MYSYREQAGGVEPKAATYEFLRCSGCEEIKLRKTEILSSDRESSDKVVPHVTYFPSALIRPKPKWLLDLFAETIFEPSASVYALLSEVYVTLQNGAPSLAAMGIRAIIEAVMIEKLGDSGTFRENLASLLHKGLISELDAQHLRTILDVGHAAIHRAHVPSVETVLGALDIAEALVKRLYLDHIVVAAAKASTPTRK